MEEDPPSAASSSHSEGESDFETLEDQNQLVHNFNENSGDEKEETDDDQHIPSNFSKQVTSLSRDSGFVSDSDSEKTQSSPSASAFTIKPIIRRHNSISSKPNKILQKSSLNSGLMMPASSGLKRSAEGNLYGAELKKKKILNGDCEEGKKVSGSGANRLWSENDEISILQGIIDFQSTKGLNLFADPSLFHEFISKNLSVDVSKKRLMDKIRRLKKKYHTNVEKGENGEDPHLSKPHEQKSFKLSKILWLGEPKQMRRRQSIKVSNSVSLSSQKHDMEAAEKVAVSVESKIFPDEFLSDYPWLKASFQMESDKFLSEGVMCLVKERLPLIGSDKARELDDKWRKLGENELELYLKKVELVREQCKLILDSVGKANS